jgi:hypothetical protein
MYFCCLLRQTITELNVNNIYAQVQIHWQHIWGDHSATGNPITVGLIGIEATVREISVKTGRITKLGSRNYTKNSFRILISPISFHNHN